jgi:tetratricopeptide (TPR) repeat protein
MSHASTAPPGSSVDRTVLEPPISSPAPWRKRASIAAVLVLVILALLVWWRRQPPRTLPEIDKQALDPAIARVLSQAENAVRRQPRSGRTWGQLGEVYLAHDLEYQALDCFRRAEELDPKDARWHYFQGVLLCRRDAETSFQHLERAATLCAASDEENTAPRLRLAEALLDHERLDAAEEQYRLVLNVQPDHPRACFGLSVIAARRGDAEENCRQLERCLASPYARKKAAADLAQHHRRRGELVRAEEYERQAAALPRDQDWPDPFTSEFRALGVGRKALLARAELLEGLGRLDEAVVVLRQVAEEYHDYHAYIALGTNLGKMNRLAAAEEAFRNALRLGPDKLQAYYYLSVSLVIAGEAVPSQESQKQRYEEAVELGRQALARKPNHALAHYYVGKALLHLDRRVEAIAELRESIQCCPDLPEAYLTLGEELAADGDVEQARVALAQVQRLAPEKAKSLAAQLARE